MENTNIFNIIGIDPGNNLGVAIYSIDCENNKIVKINTFKKVLDNLNDINSDKTIFRLTNLQKVIREIILEYKPVMVGIETAFLNKKYPLAVIQLSQYTAIIEMTILAINPFIKIGKFAPKKIKMFSGSATANKDDMLELINGIVELQPYLNTTNLSEHEIDAVAIGYIVLNQIRENPLILLTIA
jgi:Holliday junction resolvasome RuvABC endonuclease subunit